MLELKNVSFQYSNGQKQLSNICLSIEKGEFIVLTGSSGSGKTTLTRILNGLIPYFYSGKLTGDIYIDGKKSVNLKPWEFGTYIGSVFQDPRSQFFADVVQDELAFSSENYGIPTSEMQKRLSSVAKSLHIENLLLHHLQTLSSGQKQKVAVAAVQMAHPSIYVMDEPSANLDLAATNELLEVLKKLKAAGHTVIIAEHRLYYLMGVADRIIYMKDGEVKTHYSPSQLQACSKEELNLLGLRSPTLCLDKKIDNSETHNDWLVLQVKNLVKTERNTQKPLLNNITFDLKSGEIVALSGSNGVGKTSLAKILCGLSKEKHGKVLYNGVEVKVKKRYQHAWFVMQEADYQLFSDSVLKELIIGEKNLKEAEEKAEKILTELGIAEFREEHPAALSGGQKQRLTLAIALMKQTPLLILDEPTSGLDGKNLERVVKCVRAQANLGKSVLIITHDHELIQKVCTRFIFLKDGEISKDFDLSANNYRVAMDCMLRNEGRGL